MPKVVFAIGYIFLSLHCCSFQCCGAEGKPSWGEVEAAWKTRAETLPAIRVKYDIEEFQAAGTGYDREARQVKQDGTPVQPKDLKMRRTGFFSTDRSRWRWEQHGDIWEGYFEKVIARDRVMAFDGAKWTAYDFVEGEPSPVTRAGWIEPPASACEWVQMPTLIPWITLYHPLEACTAIAPDTWAPTGELTPVGDGGDLFRQTFASLKRKSQLEVTVDATQGFALRRFARDGLTVEVTHREYEGRGWYPQKWKVISLTDDGTRIASEITSSVSSLEFADSLPAKDFEVKFPPGTSVRDALPKSGKVTKAEWKAGFDYEQLENTESGELARNQTRRTWTVMLFANLGFVVAVGAVIVRRRRLKKNAGG